MAVLLCDKVLVNKSYKHR